MKNICCTLLFMIVMGYRTMAQVPVITSILGPNNVCSIPTTTSYSYAAIANNSPTSYIWSTFPSGGVSINGSGPIVTIIFPNSNFTYTVYCSAINSSGASNIASYTVAVFETPTVTFSGDGVICQGSSTNLSASSTIRYSASSSLSYNWSPSTGLNTTTGPSVLANPTITTTYTVDISLGFCVNTYQVTVAVDLCTGVKVATSGNNAALNVYPNPSNGTFIIKSPYNENVFITNDLGQVIRRIEIVANEETEIKEMPPGIYFITTRFSKNKIVVTR